MNSLPDGMREENVAKIIGRLSFVQEMEENQRWFQKQIEKFILPQSLSTGEPIRSNKDPT